MLKPTLLLISDILGNDQSQYLLTFESLLQSVFSVAKIDACYLGEIVNSNHIETNHSAFVNDGGLSKAAKNLNAVYHDVDYIVGFSIGGTIAWQACLKKLNPKLLVCVSATRLRYEIEKPKCKTRLYFGNNDIYKPDHNWSLSHQVEIKIREGGHDIYKDDSFIETISEYLKNHVS